MLALAAASVLASAGYAGIAHARAAHPAPAHPAPAHPAPAHAGTLIVRISNVRNAKGHVHVDVCPQSRFLKDDCAYSGSAPAIPGLTTVTVHGLPPGEYAVQAFHDENDDGKVNRVLFGIPKEGIGFSNDAPIHMSPPKWADARFDFRGGTQTITLKMRYMIGPSGPSNH